MKKIAILLLLVLTIAGCGKIESGTITIKNNSTHNIKCGVGENWTVKYYDVPAGHAKQVDWKNYVLVWNEKPENLVTRKKIGDTVIFENNKPSYIVSIKNRTGKVITIIDKIKVLSDEKDEYGNPKLKDITCYALAKNDENDKYVETLNIPAHPPAPPSNSAPFEKEYAFYFSLRAENFYQHSSMAGCVALFKTETTERDGKLVTIQVIELIK